MATINGNDSWLWNEADDLDGTTSADTITLFDGHDSARGDGGNDTIYGGYGDDDIEGGTGNDTLQGGWGDDDLSGGAGADLIYGGEGDDVIYGDAYYGGAGDLGDRLFGGSGYDLIYGGAGNDSIHGGDGDDVIDLGTLGEMSGDSVSGGNGVDLLRANYKAATAAITFAPTDYLTAYAAPGGFQAISIETWHIRGTDFADSLSGWKLADTLMGGKGADTITGNAGDDALYGAYASDTIYGGNGDDSIYADDTGYYDWSETPAAFGNDRVFGGYGRDYVRGGDLHDTIYGEQGDDNLHGDAGNDYVHGGVGSDVAAGGDGADRIVGHTGDDDLYSDNSLGHDDGLERDQLYGGAGNDEIWVGLGDYADGGSEAGSIDELRLTFDELDPGMTHYATGVTYNLRTQGQTLTTLANGTQVLGFEVLDFHGGAGSDRVTGGVLADRLYGGLGSDTIDGYSGNDYLDGGEGADSILGNTGNDTITDGDRQDGAMTDRASGGSGNDTFEDGYGADILSGDAGDDVFNLGSFLRSEDYLGDTIDGGTGSDRVSYAYADLGVVIDLTTQTSNAGAARGDRISNVEHIEGSGHDDRLLGGAGNDSFDGGLHDDVIQGRGGDDVLAGGGGSDSLTGGSGADSFVLERDDAWLDHENYWPHDVITDFTRGQDELAVLESEFGVDALSFRLLNQTTEVVATGGRAFVFETDTRRLWFDEDGAGRDTDGDGAIDENADAVLIATLNGVTTLSVADFGFYDF